MAMISVWQTLGGMNEGFELTYFTTGTDILRDTWLQGQIY